MEFYLRYDGPLKANGSPNDKHRIREEFHHQLKRLWDSDPLKDHRSLLNKCGNSRVTVVKDVGGHEFACLVTTKLHLLCSLDITLLWPEEAGNIVRQSGDIDNRLKTLLDALSCPDANQISGIADVESLVSPFFCLLEDDKLITSLAVRTSHLLKDINGGVSVLIHVRTSRYRAIYANSGL